MQTYFDRNSALTANRVHGSIIASEQRPTTSHESEDLPKSGQALPWKHELFFVSRSSQDAKDPNGKAAYLLQASPRCSCEPDPL